MELKDMVDVNAIKKIVSVEWDVFCQDMKENGTELEEIEQPYIHVVDLSSGGHGQYTFKVLYEQLEEKPLDMDDVDGPFYWQEECLDKWNLEVKNLLGEDYFIDWFNDGSICIFYRPLWEEGEVVDDFSENWARSKGIPADGELTEKHLKEYLEDVERVLRYEFVLGEEK